MFTRIMDFTQRLLPLLVTAIDLVERWLTNSPGPKKNQSAIDLMAHMLTVIETTADRDLLDDQLVRESLTNLVSAIVSVQNAYRDAQKRRSGDA